MNRGQLSLYAAPAFLWFSTRLFAGIRTALNDIYDVSLRGPPATGPLSCSLAQREAARHHGTVMATVFLFLANTLLSTGLVVLQARGTASVPQLAFFVSTVGRFVTELLAFTFSVSLFYVTYRYASVRRLPWSTALLASTFTAGPLRGGQAAVRAVSGELRIPGCVGRGRKPGSRCALHPLGVLHRHRVPARRRRGGNLGAPEDAGTTARDPVLN